MKNQKFALKSAHLCTDVSGLRLLLYAYKRVAITGPSGIGKSFLADKLKAFDLDDLGSEKNGKWIINVKKVAKLQDAVVVGISDNRPEWLRAYKPDLVVVVTTDNFTFFRRTQVLKAVDAGPDSPFLPYWVDVASKDDKSLRGFLEYAMDSAYSAVPEGTKVCLYVNRGNRNVERGSHGNQI